MEAYAVLETGGKQVLVRVGDKIEIEKLSVDAGQEAVLDTVLAVSDGSSLKVGSPYVEGASVTGKIVRHGKGEKIIVFKYKSKKNYRRKAGHRQPFTQVEITGVNA